MTYRIQFLAKVESDDEPIVIGEAEIHGDPEEYFTEVPSALRALAEGIESSLRETERAIEEIFRGR